MTDRRRANSSSHKYVRKNIIVTRQDRLQRNCPVPTEAELVRCWCAHAEKMAAARINPDGSPWVRLTAAKGSHNLPKGIPGNLFHLRRSAPIAE
mmetsp:Transcript_23143/g.33168  ORF Transcript_23143/g.33168 Transcript_23143/m.33168 type:complete len:94 (+) Transcript_23143:3504-3785(+)